jgi:CRISPR-associated protein Cas1
MDIILHQKGVALKVENSNFKIFDGETFHAYHPADVRSFRLGNSVLVSSAALVLAIEHGIDITIETYNGNPIGRIWSPKYGSIATIRKKQWGFAKTLEASSWVISILLVKLEMQVALISTFLFDETINESILLRTVRRILSYGPRLERLKNEPLEQIEQVIRGLEGKVAAHYFGFIGSNLPEQFRFERRTQHPALDMFNCMLNYGYGVLYGLVERELIRAGLDPYTGVLHKDRYNTPALSFDVIEQFRVWVDSVSINLCRLGVIFPEFFETEETGSWRFNNYGKKIFVTALNDYLDEIVQMNKLDRTRRTHIGLFCQNFASELLKRQ